tara:strand:+ start:275 stop:487 length:213 start_codon:yes stop_codon:yes gene_type:complete
MNPDWKATSPDEYTVEPVKLDYAETIRETYRRQGEQREKQKIISHLMRLMAHQPGASWSPKILLNIIEGL